MKKAEATKKKTRPHAEKLTAPSASKAKAAPAAAPAEAKKKTRAEAKAGAERAPVHRETGRRKTALREMRPTIRPAANQEKPRFEPDRSLIVEEATAVAPEELLVPEDIELDPLEIPLELLDPVLVDVPRPQTPPRPKPKPPRSERRMQPCAGCGGMFTWLSVDRLCFSCLKRKLSQRKREDESYSGFPGEPEEDGDN